MLTKAALSDLDQKLAATADTLITNATSILAKAKPPSEARGRRGVGFKNELKDVLHEILISGESWPLWLDDILHGIARLDWYGEREKSIPLSTRSMMKVLASLDYISTFEVSQLLRIGERHARRYAVACKIAYKHLQATSEDGRLMAYPPVFIYPRIKETEHAV